MFVYRESMVWTIIAIGVVYVKYKTNGFKLSAFSAKFFCAAMINMYRGLMGDNVIYMCV